MTINILCCTLCKKDFQVQDTDFRNRSDASYCNQCVKFSYTFEHRHSLSLDISSTEEFYAVTSQLMQVDQPTNNLYCSHQYCFSRSFPDGNIYWLCYYYDRISIRLLKTLVLLRNRYTLYDIETHQDSLRFWPDYSAPQGTLV